MRTLSLLLLQESAVIETQLSPEQIQFARLIVLQKVMFPGTRTRWSLECLADMSSRPMLQLVIYRPSYLLTGDTIAGCT